MAFYDLAILQLEQFLPGILSKAGIGDNLIMLCMQIVGSGKEDTYHVFRNLQQLKYLFFYMKSTCCRFDEGVASILLSSWHHWLFGRTSSLRGYPLTKTKGDPYWHLV